MTGEPGTDGKDQYAAIDLGSNSFHMVVARHGTGEFQILDRLREPVRLAAGLGPDGRIDGDARARALACLRRFGQRLRELPRENVRAVGTNTLRRAKSSRDFLTEAGNSLGHEIEVVSGVEEARLIYLGVTRSLGDDGLRRLVMDIGGGSTELIVGEDHVAHLMESLNAGCVGLTSRHFADGRIDAERFRRAELEARLELEPVEAAFRKRGWQRVVGASGTIRSVASVLRENAWSDFGVDLPGLERLRSALIDAGHVDRVSIRGLSRSRAQVLPGGVGILLAAFRGLGLERMEAADGALREGVLHDLVGRFRKGDVREATVMALARRYHVDRDQSRRVADTADALLAGVDAGWRPRGVHNRRLLAWAAQLHEIGLDIAHSQYHKHGAYITAHGDMAGFSRDEQLLISHLVRSQRRKFRPALFGDLPEAWSVDAERLAIILRLAVLWHRSRSEAVGAEPQLEANARRLRLMAPAGWLVEHPLLVADIEQEKAYLSRAGYRLDTAEAIAQP